MRWHPYFVSKNRDLYVQLLLRNYCTHFFVGIVGFLASRHLVSAILKILYEGFLAKRIFQYANSFSSHFIFRFAVDNPRVYLRLLVFFAVHWVQHLLCVVYTRTNHFKFQHSISGYFVLLLWCMVEQIKQEGLGGNAKCRAFKGIATSISVLSRKNFPKATFALLFDYTACGKR